MIATRKLSIAVAVMVLGGSVASLRAQVSREPVQKPGADARLDKLDSLAAAKYPVLPAPASATATVTGANQVTITWSAVPGVTGYVVRRFINYGGYTLEKVATPPASATSYIDGGLPMPVKIEYSVSAVNANGESTSSATTTVVPLGARIWGIADTHTHVLANLAFGGLFFWGQPYGAEEYALQECDPAHDLGWLGNLLLGASGKHPSTKGHPDYAGWPSWNTGVHQQMYYKWLRRAYLGGLRLIVLLAVNNEVLCKVWNKNALGRTCDDMEAVDLQLQHAKIMESRIDAEYGGPGRGWFHIVRSGREARDAINNGQMAVVLGIEVDNLFGCRQDGPCVEQTVRDALQKYYDLGVRHVFPIHFANNAFGGFAPFENFQNLNNRMLTGRYVNAAECSALGMQFRFEPLSELEQKLIGFFGVNAPPPAYGPGAHCNELGLTPLGEFFIRELVAQHMIIDIDHMSTRAIDRTLQLVGSYPVISGHTGFVETSIGAKKSEGQKTAAQVDAIKSRGGMVSLILHQGNTREVSAWGSKVANNCSGSSKSWAQAYLYAVDRLGGPTVAAVGLASDQGLNPMIAPRFGTDGCSGEQSAPQSAQVSYPINTLVPTADPNSPTLRLPQDQRGTRSFNYNTDGLAHIGLLPDFVQDLQNVGLSQADLAPLFRSAEAYVAMWERIDAATNAFPQIVHAATPVIVEKRLVLQKSAGPRPRLGQSSVIIHAVDSRTGATVVGTVTFTDGSRRVVSGPTDAALAFAPCREFDPQRKAYMGSAPCQGRVSAAGYAEEKVEIP